MTLSWLIFDMTLEYIPLDLHIDLYNYIEVLKGHIWLIWLYKPDQIKQVSMLYNYLYTALLKKYLHDIVVIFPMITSYLGNINSPQLKYECEEFSNWTLQDD